MSHFIVIWHRKRNQTIVDFISAFKQWLLESDKVNRQGNGKKEKIEAATQERRPPTPSLIKKHIDSFHESLKGTRETVLYVEGR